MNKNEAELMLNDMRFEDLPPAIRQAVVQSKYKRTKYGNMVRRYFPKVFHDWYNKTYA